jgi:hypothetical protein
MGAVTMSFSIHFDSVNDGTDSNHKGGNGQQNNHQVEAHVQPRE